MAPIRHSRKNADASNPEKWTLTKLRQKLTHQGISSPPNSSKAELLRIYKDAEKSRQISPQNADAEARSDNKEQQHANTGDLSSLIKDLVENINSMKFLKGIPHQDATSA